MSRFKVGQLVEARTGGVGVVLTVRDSPPEASYQIFLNGRSQPFYESQLQASAAAADERKALTVRELHAYLTSLQILSPSTANLFSLRSGRVHFVPYQYRPVLKLIRADRPRLLIADEVGVGKTIEAGLIIKELQTRQQVGNVLIVCPKSLVTKWQKEMRRFDEDFLPLTSERLRYCLRETHMDGTWPHQYSRAIVHLELLRAEEYLFGTEGRHRRPGLMELDPPPFFSAL